MTDSDARKIIARRLGITGHGMASILQEIDRGKWNDELCAKQIESIRAETHKLATENSRRDALKWAAEQVRKWNDMNHPFQKAAASSLERLVTEIEKGPHWRKVEKETKQ